MSNQSPNESVNISESLSGFNTVSEEKVFTSKVRTPVDFKLKKNLDGETYQKEIDIENIISNNFSDIVFETIENCPSGYDNLNYESDNSGDFDSSCSRERLELENGQTFVVYQKYVNGRLIEYSESIEGTEPVRVIISSSGELEEIDLFIDGSVVFGIEFKNNLVDSSHINKHDMELFFKGIKKYYENDMNRVQQRLTLLNEGKMKVQKIIQDICQKSLHDKTCNAYEKLRKFKITP